MALNFPASPALDDIHTDGNYKFQWDGDKWVSIGPAGRFTEIRSPTGNNRASITDAQTGGLSLPAQFNVSFGGTNKLTILSSEAEFTTDVNLPAGSAAGPSLYFNDDNNTGLYADADDTVNIATNGTHAVTVDSSQNVGIGTTAPDAKLNVSLADDSTDVYFHGGGLRGLKINDDTITNDGDHTKFFKNSATGTYTFSNSGGELIRFKSSGDIEFGSNSTNDSTHFAPNGFAEFDRRQDTNFGLVRFNSSQKGIAIGNTDGNIVTTLDYDGGANFGSGYVTLNGNQIGGIQVTIADDAFATITPPRVGGGWVFLTTRGTSVFPYSTGYASAFLDWGNSPQVSAVSGGGDVNTSISGPPTGTTGANDKVTVFVGGTSGKIYIENRLGTNENFQLTFI